MRCCVWRNFINLVKCCQWHILSSLGLLVNSAFNAIHTIISFLVKSVSFAFGVNTASSNQSRQLLCRLWIKFPRLSYKTAQFWELILLNCDITHANLCHLFEMRVKKNKKPVSLKELWAKYKLPKVFITSHYKMISDAFTCRQHVDVIDANR